MGSEDAPSLLARARAVLAEDGVAGVGWRFLRWLGVYRSYGLYGGVNVPADEPGPALDLDCARLGPDEIDAYLEFRPDQARAEVERRFRDGDHGYVARSEGRIVCSVWVARGSAWLPFVPCRVRLAERAFYTYDVYVPEALRGQRVANVVIDYRAARMRELGCDRKVSVVEPENRSSLQRNLRRGLTDLGRLTCLRIGPWRRVRIHPSSADVDPWVTLE